MTTMTATDARMKFFELIKGVNSRHEIYHIHHKEGAAVLLSEDEFESMIETLNLLSSKEFRRDFDISRKEVQDGDVSSFEDVFGESQ